MAFENRLSPQEVLTRRNDTFKVVDHTCQFSPWNQIISRVVLFGSLGRNVGDHNSDADVSFFSNDISIPNVRDYKELTTLLIQTVDRCREIYEVEFFINPFLVFESWFEYGSRPYLIPGVIESIKNEGITILTRQ